MPAKPNTSPDGPAWQTDTTIPVLLAHTLDDAALLQAACKGVTEIAVVLWDALPPLLLSHSAVQWYARTLAFYRLSQGHLPALEALADAEKHGALLQELPWTQPDLSAQLASVPDLAYWVRDGLPPNLDRLLDQARELVTPAGMARQFLTELATMDEEARFGAIWAEEILTLLADMDDERDWALWRREAKKLCPELNITLLMRARSQRKTHAQGATDAPRNGTHAAAEDAADWRGALQCSNKGALLQNTYNVLHVLRHHPTWTGRLWWDAVREVAMLDQAPLGDPDVVECMYWFGSHTGMSTTRRACFTDALETACLDHKRDLIREPLDALPPWDGVERLDYWLSDYAGMPRTAHNMLVSRLLPVSMIARAYHPGCQYRYVVIFEGQENIGKSKLLRELATPEWYREISSSLEGKESHILIQGAWLVEFGELESLSRTAENRLKSFITMQSDAYVPKYKNYTLTVPRRTVFVGTTNEVGQQTNKGQTGNTRYLYVVCGEMRPDELHHIRAQLFAEAKAYYEAHLLDWWQFSDEAETEARDIREARREKSIYEDLLASWLPENASQENQTLVTWWEQIAEDCLDLHKAQWSDKKIQMEVVRALRALGWQYNPTQTRLLDKHGRRLKVRTWTYQFAPAGQEGAF